MTQSNTPIKGNKKPQIAKILYHQHKQSMKEMLRMGEFKFTDTKGRRSEGYKHYRKKVMDIFYKQLNLFFKLFEESGLIEDCGCGHSLDNRTGYQPCQFCAGCGKKNSEYLNDAMAYAEGWSPNKFEMIKQLIEEEAKKQKTTVTKITNDIMEKSLSPNT